MLSLERDDLRVRRARGEDSLDALEHEKRHRAGQVHFVVVDDPARRQERELESIERVSVEGAVAGWELYGPVGPPREVLAVIPGSRRDKPDASVTSRARPQGFLATAEAT